MATYFEVMGLAPAYHLNKDELQTRYLALSQKLHPDRHVRATPAARLQAVQKTTDLNEARRTLKDDFKRAAYLLKLEGLDISEEKASSSAIAGAPQLKIDQQFLFDIMELREELQGAQVAGDVEKVRALAAQVKTLQAQKWQLIDAAFTVYEAGDKSQLGKTAEALLSLRYYARFIEEVESFEDKLHEEKLHEEMLAATSGETHKEL